LGLGPTCSCSNSSCVERTMSPGCEAVPSMVYVLPDDVMPYVITTALSRSPPTCQNHPIGGFSEVSRGSLKLNRGCRRRAAPPC
jgi:hypothetical protein